MFRRPQIGILTPESAAVVRFLKGYARLEFEAGEMIGFKTSEIGSPGRKDVLSLEYRLFGYCKCPLRTITCVCLNDEK
jgi:hypothetical protein